MKRIKTYGVFESKESGGWWSWPVEDICREYNIRNWTLNPDGTIDVDGDVNLNSRGLGELPLKFGRVTGDFYCSQNMLTSLVGSPNWVGGNFGCLGNQLTSLVGSPNWVGGNFGCLGNKLTSLEGSPNWVGGYFTCLGNQLTTLEGCPEKIYGDLMIQNNEIYLLDHYPTILTGRLYTSGNPINEIWDNVIDHKLNNHGVLLTLLDLHGPIRFEGGKWVCYRECLDNFFDEIGVPSPPKLKNYKEV